MARPSGAVRSSLALAFTLALAAAITLPGCATSDKIRAANGMTGAPGSYYKEYAGSVEPNLDRTFDLVVRERATLVNVTLALTTRSGGIAGAAPSPAQLEIRLLAPDGSPAKNTTVNAQQPAAVLLLDAPHAGTYRVHLTGNGFSSPIAGAQYGASYVLILQTEYA